MSQYYSRKLKLQRFFLGNHHIFEIVQPTTPNLQFACEAKLSLYARPDSSCVRQLPSPRLLKETDLAPFLIVVMVHHLGEHVDHDKDRFATLGSRVDMPVSDIFKAAFVQAPPLRLEKEFVRPL